MNKNPVQDYLFYKILVGIWMEHIHFKDKVKKCSSLGLLTSDKKNVQILLQDGTVTDLFNTELSCNTIMHGINIAKIKRSETIDLSNIKIDGDFICTGIKTDILFPKQINGILDCSFCSQQLLIQNVIPDGTIELKAESTLKTFKVLTHLPNTLQQIFVSDSLIKSVQKDYLELQYAEQLLQKYPNINIIGKNNDLRSLMNEIHQNNKLQNIESEKNVPQETNQRPMPKPNNYISRKELFDKCKQDAQIVSLSDEELSRLIQIAIKRTSIKEQRFLNQDNKECTCIENIQNNINNIINFILEIHRNTKQQKKPTTTATENTSKQKEQLDLPIEPDISAEIVFDIYIPKKVWSDIQKSVGGKNNVLLRILSTIKLVNLDINNQKTQGGVQYLTIDKTYAVIKQLHKKVGYCITQSIDLNHASDRKRIVWSMNPKDKIIIATSFFEEHQTPKTWSPYKTAYVNAGKMCLPNGTVISKQLIENDKDRYINVKETLAYLWNYRIFPPRLNDQHTK